MSYSAATLGRAALLWSAITTAAGAVGSLVASDAFALADGAADPETALIRASSLALLGCAGWAWLVTTVSLVEALRGRQVAVPGVPAWVRRSVLGACGVALVGGLASPSLAAPGPPAADPAGAATVTSTETDAGRSTNPATDRLAGLPIPDRALDGPRRPAHAVVVVLPGQSLWHLAEASLPRRTPAAEVAARTRAVHHLNRARIGPDPDLIHPGQRLRLPTRTAQEPR